MKPLLSNKLKNQVQKLNLTIESVKLKNIIINHQKKGCSGFFYNPQNQRYIYVNTEPSCYAPLSNKILVRYAKNDSDYIGETNQFVSYDNIAKTIVNMLAK